MKLRTLVLAAGLLWSTSAFSQDITGFKSGNALYEECNSPISSPAQTDCMGYVQGLTDALNMVRTICTPEHVTVGQSKDIIMDGLRAMPEYRHLAASALAGAALKTAFPCK